MNTNFAVDNPLTFFIPCLTRASRQFHTAPKKANATYGYRHHEYQ
ncbi:hypothetical protein RINTU1_18980 [Candidatus Regiella insecticola]|uniref:Uncharacterized protein n=1 Tax=Candidatus Regiella insecticola TaxID=138073 RepID=A0A6L2ZNC3_9ENTR|nr:hypothetical protein RINTU1_18980 [Candidatus Regiella insecticola]